MHRLFFMHVPKCAGTSLTQYIKLHYSESRSFTKWGWTDLTYDNILTLDNYDLITGHFDARILPFIPSDFIKITCVRDPLSRAVSAIGHSLRSADRAPKHIQALLKGKTFSDVLREPQLREYFSNSLTKFFSGRPPFFSDCVGFQQHSETECFALENVIPSVDDALQIALQFDTIFYVDHIDDAFANLAYLFNSDATRAAHRCNIAESKPTLHKDDVDILYDWNRADCEFYTKLKAMVPHTRARRTPPPSKIKVTKLPVISAPASLLLQSPFAGWNWHDGEGESQTFRWSGPEKESGITVRVQHGKCYNCQMSVLFPKSNKNTTLTISVNEEQVHSHTNAPSKDLSYASISFKLNKTLSYAEYIDISFNINNIHKSKKDKRRLGFALISFTISPVPSEDIPNKSLSQSEDVNGEISPSPLDG